MSEQCTVGRRCVVCAVALAALMVVGADQPARLAAYDVLHMTKASVDGQTHFFDIAGLHRDDIFPGLERDEETPENGAVGHYAELATLFDFPAALRSTPSRVAFDPLSSTFVDLLDYLGYGEPDNSISPKEVESLSPDELSSRFPGAILATRFFAPKIMDMKLVQEGTPKPGWRKLVRLTPLDGSRAQRNEMASAWVLFNYILEPGDTPFQPQHVSSNNQVMLIPSPERIKKTRAAYWLVYDAFDSQVKGQLLRGIKGVQFELRTRDYYFTPQSCAQCHGGLDSADTVLKNGKLNFLDSDHWFDKRSAEVPVVAESEVLFDAQFEVLRQLNREIHEQNKRADEFRIHRYADSAGRSIQTRGTAQWLTIHETDDTPQPVLRRALPPRCDDALVWEADDEELLIALDKYCYRCHNSVKDLNVFDKDLVVEERVLMAFFIDIGNMPQDRTLLEDEKTRLINLLGKLSKFEPDTCRKRAEN